MFKWKCFIVCTINLAKTLLFQHFMFMTGQLIFFDLPTYPYSIDLGRRRGNKKYFKLGPMVMFMDTSICGFQIICNITKKLINILLGSSIRGLPYERKTPN